MSTSSILGGVADDFSLRSVLFSSYSLLRLLAPELIVQNKHFLSKSRARSASGTGIGTPFTGSRCCSAKVLGELLLRTVSFYYSITPHARLA